MVEDTDAEKALKAPPISVETLWVIVCVVVSVWDTPIFVE